MLIIKLMRYLDYSIIIEWTDASWKEQLWKIIKKITWQERKHINDILDLLDIDIIKFNDSDLDKILNYYINNNLISDRSFLSLLNYFISTDHKYLENLFIIRKLLLKYLKSINWWILLMLTTNYKESKRRLLFRKKELWEELSKNDINIVNSEIYFYKYKSNLEKLLKISISIIEKENLNIKILKIDTSFLNLFFINLFKKLIN